LRASIGHDFDSLFSGYINSFLTNVKDATGMMGRQDRVKSGDLVGAVVSYLVQPDINVPNIVILHWFKVLKSELAFVGSRRHKHKSPGEVYAGGVASSDREVLEFDKSDLDRFFKAASDLSELWDKLFWDLAKAVQYALAPEERDQAGLIIPQDELELEASSLQLLDAVAKHAATRSVESLPSVVGVQEQASDLKPGR